MKLAIDVRMAHASGIGTYIRNVVPGVIEQMPHSEFCLLGGPDALEVFEEHRSDNVKLIDVRSKIYSIREQIELWQKTPRDCDTFWAPHYNIPLSFRGTLIVTIHDTFHLAHPELAGGPHKQLFAKLMFSALVRKASQVLTVSSFTQSELIRLTTINPGTVEPIHNGVDSSWFDASPGPRPEDPPYFVFVGNVKPHKNLISLIEAFSMIKEEIPHSLVIIGKRDGFITGDDGVAEVAEKCGDRIVFTGFIDDDTLKQYIASAEAMIFPSLYEGFGLPPLEAMASGCPVATSNTAALPEVCGDAALYFDPLDIGQIADKMRTLATDPDVREALRIKGKARAARFSWDDCVTNTAMAIDRTISGKS